MSLSNSMKSYGREIRIDSQSSHIAIFSVQELVQILVNRTKVIVSLR